MTFETQMFDNGVQGRRKPALSVLIPFQRNDPTALLAGLARLDAAMDVVLLDNGSGDDARAASLMEAMLSLKHACRLVRLPAKLSWAMARNRLAVEARAERRLFVDVGAPNACELLRRTLAMIEREEAAASRPRAMARGVRASAPMSAAAAA